MLTSVFDNILKDFEPFFNCTLQSDANHSCKIEMGFGISIQIEINQENQVIIGSIVGELPPGVYRDRLIRQALKSNNSSPLSSGTFGYSKKSNHLISFLLIHSDKITPDYIFEILPPFIEKAKLWKEAIEENQLPAVEDPSKENTKGHGLFGFIH